MKKSIYFPLLSFMGCLVSTPALLHGQTLTVVSGNGQIISPRVILAGTLAKPFVFFEPMTVKVTDSSGNPLPNSLVTWTVTSGTGNLSTTLSSTDSTTSGATAGITNATYFAQTTPVGTPQAPYSQSTIVASTGTSSVTFYLTQALTDSNGNFLVQTGVTSPASGTTITGTSGGTGTPPIQVNVSSTGGVPVPNVSVQLINVQDGPGVNVAPPANCATSAGAGANSVLTDANGNATCTPIMQGSAGSGAVYVLFGGIAVAPANDANNQTTNQFDGGPLGYTTSGAIPVTVTAATPGSITITGGNQQTANPGQALTTPLTAKVGDLSGNAISGQQVTWTVSPAGSAGLSNTTSTSDVNGIVSTTVTISNGAVGQIQITAALTSNSKISTTFTETANVQISALQKISGDNQSAAINTAFSQPLVVQVNGTNSQPVANAGVQFSISGPGTLSAPSATTGANGQAQVTVTAGATAGTITVTASIGGQSVSFGLTATPPAPAITSANFYSAAGFYTTDANHSPLSPCAITSIIAPGVAPGVQGIVSPTAFGLLPYQVANVTITVNNSQAPIYSVSNVNGQQQVNFQVPCSVAPGANVPVAVTVNGVTTMVNVTVRSAGPGIFETTMSDGSRQAVLIRPDGSFVDPQTNPARPGDIVTMYVTGIGPTSPPVSTNSVAPRDAQGNPIPVNATGQIIVGVNNAGVRVVSSQLSPDIVGVAEVAFQVPSSGLTSGTYVLSMGINEPDNSATQFSQGSKITVHQ